ncbi:hypothetical protein AeNC1_014969 [Aphanomyces euteiches]|nr:hypothetical protein AeNC1_014969 [Aphanomyces euteiches]
MVRFLLLSALLVASVLAQFNASKVQGASGRVRASFVCSVIQQDVDYEGSVIAKTSQCFAEQCCGDCSANPLCQFFVYYQGICYLKSAVGNQVAAPGRIAGFPKAIPSTCSALQTDTDYSGANIATTQRSSADQCCDDCQNNAACKLFVWFQGVCYLKGTPGTQTTSSGRVAGFPRSKPNTCSTLQPNTDYADYNIGTTQRVSADLCCDDCKATPLCQLFVWYQGVCYLKSAKGTQTYTDGATAGFVPATGPTCGAVESNTDYPGKDLYTARASDVGACCKTCINESACNAYTWSQDGSCYLKSARGGASTNSGATSARVNKCSAIEQGVDYIGNDLSSATASSVDDCCALCRNTNGCKAYTYGYGVCYFKTGKGATKANPDVSSATVL